LLTAGCSERKRSASDEADWSDIQPLSDQVVSTLQPAAGATTRTAEPEEDYSEWVARLSEMKTISRSKGETLLAGESLVFDYDRHHVRMDGAVRVVDDHGELETETLVGYFSVSNEVEYVEARRGVRISSGNRKALAENATYDYKTGEVVLAGRAEVADGENRLSGEQITMWLENNRRMICEPNAMLEVQLGAGWADETPAGSGDTTEIRGTRLVYDEKAAMASFSGNVRLRNPKAAMNCDEVVLHLKENNEIDWIEAFSEVIIQSDDRKALADKAIYYADEQKFVLEGDPKVKQGQHIMAGERIVFWHGDRRMVCEPNARVLLYPDEEMKAKFLKDLKD
jgi:lipopolysaccharide export system protein LptA